MQEKPLAEPKSRRPWSEVVAELEAQHRAQAGPRWHLVQVAPGEREKHADEWIDRLDYERYSPMVRRITPVPRRSLTRADRRAGVKLISERLEPLLPRYRFVRFDASEGQWTELSHIAGVTGIVINHGQPVPIADALITKLRKEEREKAIPGELAATSVFDLGVMLHVKDPHSPFVDFEGPIERMRLRTIQDVDVADRLTITLNIFGRLTPVEFEPDQVEPV